jgi:SAM-dependent methyltransferase
MKREVAKTSGDSKFFCKLAKDLAYAPSGIIMRTAEAELLSAIAMEPPILDLGCGDGYFASLVKPEGMDVGCDTSKPALKRATARKQYRALVQCDATKSIPFPNEWFATVISNSSLEHMDDIDAVLRQISRVLRRGGKLIFTLASSYAYEWWPLDEAAKQRYLNFQPVYSYFSLEEWQRRLTTVGLNLVAHQYYLDKMATQRVMWLDYHFGQVYLTRHWTPARPLIQALRFVPRRALAKLWMRMFGKFPICVNDAGGGILIVAGTGLVA